jgi:16S rRNA (adenine1518-N6/adenine1519-N6)-dimethyltransferase
MIGTIIGDIVGSVYEWDNIKTKDFPLFRQDCSFTDDTVMTLAIAEGLMNGGSSDHFAAAMKKYGLLPKKRLGQNFLLDRNVLTKIADSCAIEPDQYLVEIGPGLGGLTQELAARSRGVLAIEIDNSFEPVLNALASENTNIKFLFRDVLKVDIEAELRRAFELNDIVSYQVCANIPYNITTPIIFQLLETCPRMQAATLLMQKEVAERILAKPGGKDYGRLTLTTAYYANVQHVMNVSRNCFYPQPEVDSSVLKITPLAAKKVMVNHEDVFRSLLRAAFQKRRKTILNIPVAFSI